MRTGTGRRRGDWRYESGVSGDIGIRGGTNGVDSGHGEPEGAPSGQAVTDRAGDATSEAVKGGATDTAVPESLLWEAAGLARSAALRLGLSPDDADDCAMAFCLFLLTPLLPTLPRGAAGSPRTPGPLRAGRVLRADLPPGEAAAWRLRCARNFAANYRRALARQAARGGADGESGGAGAASVRHAAAPPLPFPAAPSAEEACLGRAAREAARGLLRDAVERLARPQRDLMLRHHGADLNDIGMEHRPVLDAGSVSPAGPSEAGTRPGAPGPSSPAERQALRRARLQVRSHLERRGHTAEDLRRALD